MGKQSHVEQFLDAAFGYLDLNWRDYAVQDSKFMRPAEVDLLVGDPTKAKTKLGWGLDVDFKGLVGMMVEADLALVNSGQAAF